MINLHWSFRWGYGEVFLSNCCFKKGCVDSTPPPPVLIGLGHLVARYTSDEKFENSSTINSRDLSMRLNPYPKREHKKISYSITNYFCLVIELLILRIENKEIHVTERQVF